MPLLFHRTVNNTWQNEWDTNANQKLFEIMPNIGEFNVSNLKRKEQVLIHRIRIGHTRLTHSFRMEGRSNPPQCDFCREELTVKHIMLFCRRFSTIRSRFYNIQDMRELFRLVSLRKILSYVKQIGLYNCL